MAAAATKAASLTIGTSKTITDPVLPPRLINFFKRYPPRLYSVHFTGQRIENLAERIAREGNKKTGTPPSISQDERVSLKSEQKEAVKQAQEAHEKVISQPLPDTTTKETPQAVSQGSADGAQFDASPSERFPPNPFLPYRNPSTGRWRGPVVSLRRQADLFKLARTFGVEPLLPPSMKSSEYKTERLLARGTGGAMVKGTGEGQKVKGHKWERQLGGLLEKRIKAMEGMPELIREWQSRGHGRGWKKYPK